MRDAVSRDALMHVLCVDRHGVRYHVLRLTELTVCVCAGGRDLLSSTFQKQLAGRRRPQTVRRTQDRLHFGWAFAPSDQRPPIPCCPAPGTFFLEVPGSCSQRP